MTLAVDRLCPAHGGWVSRGANPARTLAITGAGGFLGNAITRAAIAAGWHTRAISRRQPPRGAEWRAADFQNAFELGTAFSGAGIVIHSAGLAHQHHTNPDAARFEEINVAGTRRAFLSAIAAGASHFVLISSVSVYGTGVRIADESAPCTPETDYARSKFRAEQVVRELSQQGGLNAIGLTILRLGTLYGPGDPGNVARLMSSIDRGRFFFPGPCAQRKSLLHVEDAAEACLAAARSRPSGTYNVTGPVHTMREIGVAIAEVLGRDSRRIPTLPEPVAGAALWMAGVAGWWHPKARSIQATAARFASSDEFDSSRFRWATGFWPVVPLCIGLAQQAAWYRARRFHESPTLGLRTDRSHV